jgi:UDP-glucose 4-epimerase
MNKARKKKRILICGGTGFIGQKLVKELLRQGREVRVFQGDILNKKELMPAMEKADIVVNLVGSFDKDIYLLNVLASANLLEVSKEFNIEKIIFISSQTVYGEYSGRQFTESDPAEPITEYGLSKYLAEQIYRFYSKKYNMPTVILRLSNVYGPGQKKGVIFNFINAVLKDQSVTIYGNGKQQRDFLYLDDAVDGIVKSIDYKLKGFDIFNIPGPKTHSLLKVLALIEENFKKKVNVKFLKSEKEDVRCMSSNYQKAEDFLKYKPKISLEKGIKEIISQKTKNKNKNV